MKANYRAAASAGLMLSACAQMTHGATTVQTTVGPQAASSNFDVLFSSTISSVTDLVSISDGSVYTGEGAMMTVSAILPDDSLVQLFSRVSSPFQNISLSTLTGNMFSDLATPQEIKGLRFGSSGGNVAGTFALPALTVLTFAVIPEPGAAIAMLLGCVFLAVRRRRMAA